MASASSSNFRRMITRKRNSLALLLPDVAQVIDADLTKLSGDELTAIANKATRFKSELAATYDVVNENGRKWQRLIETFTDEETKNAELKELDLYFEDSDSHPLKSIESIHNEITTQSTLLDSVVQNVERMLNRLSLKQVAPVVVENTVPPAQSFPMPSHVVTHLASVPLPSLPNLTLQSFDGKGCWETYWQGFSEIIDKRSEIGDSTKLRYLQSSLTGEASDLFTHLLKRGCEYKEVVNGLQNEYKGTAKTHQHLLKEFGALKPKNDSMEEQLKTIRSFETLIAQLKGQNADPDNNPYCLHSVIERFSPYCQKLVHIKMRESGDGLSSTSISLSEALSALKIRLRDEIELRELCPRRPKGHAASDTPVSAVSAQAGNRSKPSRPVNGAKGRNGSFKYPAREFSGNSGTAQTCIFCGTHPDSFVCDRVKPFDKRRIVREQSRCYKCFQQGHPSSSCTRPRCESCVDYDSWGNHHPSLCLPKRTGHPSRTTKSFVPKQYGNRSQTTTAQFSSQSASAPPVPMVTATSGDRIRMLTSGISISNPSSGSCSRVDAFLDCGAAVSLISAKTRSQLALPTIRRDILDLTGVGGIRLGECEYEVVELSLATADGPMMIEACVHDEPLTGSIPMATLSNDDRLALRDSGVTLADSPNRKGRVNPRLLIGGKDFYRVTGLAEHRLPSGLFVVNTLLGAMIAGEKETESLSRRECPLLPLVPLSAGSKEQEQEQMLLKFLSLDLAGKDDQMSTERIDREAREKKVQEQFEQNIEFRDGHYHVRYSFNEKLDELTDGFNQAWVRLKGMHKKIANDQSTLVAVDQIFRKQIEAGQIEIVEEGDGGPHIRYIPLQLVVKESSATTPHRVVIDASAHGKHEPSLNDCLEGSGANFLEQIPRMLLRIQLHEVLFAGDIEKAFLQVKIFPDQRDLLRVLWLKDPLKPLSIENLLILRYCSAAFGVAQSPFILMATLRHHANIRFEQIKSDRDQAEIDRLVDQRQIEDWDLEESILKSIMLNCYVDNVFFSCTQSTDREALFQMAKKVFSSMGMNIRAFFSSDIPFIRSLSDENGDRGPIQETKILGVGYDPVTDEWVLKCDMSSKSGKCTKRHVTSKMAGVYQPVGQLIPLLLQIKLFVQKLWLKEYGWDDAIDESDLSEWIKRVNDALLPELRIPRRITMPTDRVHLALFTDGSFMATGAVVYIWTPDGARFLMARNQLAPIRGTKTTPKLELQALVMGMNLLLYVTQSISAEHPLVSFEFQVYTDATTLLYWLESSGDPSVKSKNLGVYVTNRLRKIHEIQSELRQYAPEGSEQWIRYDHVAGSENPSDHATRGLTAIEMSDVNHIWWKGPEWLSLPPDQWKREFSTRSSLSAISDLKVAVSQTSSDESAVPVLSVLRTQKKADMDALKAVDPLDLIDVSRFSRFDKLRRVTAFVLRFIKRKCPTTFRNAKVLRSPPQSGTPSKSELEEAEIVLIRAHQRDNVSSWDCIPGAEIIKDDDGLIRITSGRVDNAMIDETAKHPILLFAKNDALPRLLIDSTHRDLMHRGTEHTLSELRQKFWIVKGRSIVQSVLRRCITCRKAYNRPYQYPQAPPLPPERICESRPYQHLGIDMLGPIRIKNETDTVVDHQKGYVLLLTCMSTRLIHLETTKVLSTISFLNALDRFISRRGAPDTITSDNAPTFKLADKLLRERWESFRSDEAVLSFVATRMIEWRWITAYSPWQGGFYERLVGCVKAAFNSVFLRRTLTMDEFMTQMCKVEAILNSRPLTHVSSDLQSSLELPILRPCDFISPRVQLAVPHSVLNKEFFADPDYVPPSEMSVSRKELIDRFRKAEQSLDKFWEMFRKHYVTELREHNLLHPMRTNYRARAPSPFPYEIVLVVDENAPRGTWKMAKVIKVNERSVTLLSSSGKEISRPVNRIIPLELVSSDQSNPTNTGDSFRPELRRSSRKAAAKAREKFANLPSDNESDQEETVSLSSMRDRKETRKGGRMLDQTLAGIPMNAFCPSYLPGQLQSHNRTTVRSLTGPWSFSGLFGITLLCLSMMSVVSSVNLECHHNGARLRHETDFPTYQVCGDGDCVMVQPLPDSLVEWTPFNPVHTIHGFTVSAKFLRGGDVQAISLECPAYQFCDSITCTFCLAALANPECNIVASLCAGGMILYLISLLIYSVCYNPLVLSSPLIGMCGVLWCVSRYLFRCLSMPLHMFLRWARGRTATQRSKPIRTIIFLSITILCNASMARACQEVIELTGISRNCEEGKCTSILTTMLKINPISRDACIALTVNDTLAGQLRLEMKDASLRCEEDNHGFHRDTEVKYVHAKRCPHQGTCKGPKCGNVTSSSLVDELAAGNNFPGHTYCAESCGGIGCDCFWPSSGCLFYRTFCEPRSDIIYRTFDCPMWRPTVSIESTLTIGNETKVEMYSLRPNERMKIPGVPYVLTLTNFAVPPIPLLNSPFILSETDGKMALLTSHPNVICETKEQATTLNCTSEESCVCTSGESAAHCECKQSSLEKNFELDKVFPLVTPQLRLRSDDGKPIASLYQSVSTEITVALRGDEIKNDHLEIVPIRCTVSVSSVSGCYDCLIGSRVSFTCSAREGNGLATVQCPRDSFTIPCDPTGAKTERSLSFAMASVSETCQVSCGDPVTIKGVLKYAGVQSDISITESISWNGTEINWPDFEHIGGVFLRYWMSSLICIAIVSICVFLTVSLLPTIIPRLAIAVFGKRRGSYKPPQKEL